MLHPTLSPLLRCCLFARSRVGLDCGWAQSVTCLVSRHRNEGDCLGNEMRGELGFIQFSWGMANQELEMTILPLTLIVFSIQIFLFSMVCERNQCWREPKPPSSPTFFSPADLLARHTPPKAPLRSVLSRWRRVELLLRCWFNSPWAAFLPLSHSFSGAGMFFLLYFFDLLLFDLSFAALDWEYLLFVGGIGWFTVFHLN